MFLDKAVPPDIIYKIMKNLIFLLSLPAFLLLSGNLFGQKSETATFKVFGNCGMCKERIEKAVVMKGVKSGSWDNETHMLTVTFDPRKTTVDKIQLRLAAVGHDTDKYRAKDSVYDKLHGCCKYRT
jgi:hypothetical protein